VTSIRRHISESGTNWGAQQVLGLGQLQSQGVRAQGALVQGEHLTDLGRAVAGCVVVEHDLQTPGEAGCVR